MSYYDADSEDYDSDREDYLAQLDEDGEGVGFDLSDADDDDFADPTGVSALRAATPSNPRNLPCPDCEQPNRLTPKDKARGYCCDDCADRNEGKFGRGDY